SFSFFKVFGVRIVIKGFKLKRVVSISDPMAMTFCAGQDIEETIKQPVENKQQLYLLPEVNRFMSHQAYFIFFKT
ncbi:MAG TPA: hypothetical protein VD927_00705, partial [Chryseosolibacter sp.]|nr:hypothetical protein [Chryseosolibacter sp.]